MKKHSASEKKKSGAIDAQKKSVKAFKKTAHIARVAEPSLEVLKGRAWTMRTQRPVERIVLESSATRNRVIPTAEPTTLEMVDAGLDAFSAMTQRLALTRAQEAALLGVSPSTWERYRNRKNLSVLDTRKEFVDRLRLILLIYESSVQFASSQENAEIDLKFAGGAMDPADPSVSILDAMMADTSTLDLDRLYHRVDSRIGAV